MYFKIFIYNLNIFSYSQQGLAHVVKSQGRHMEGNGPWFESKWRQNCKKQNTVIT